MSMKKSFLLLVFLFSCSVLAQLNVGSESLEISAIVDFWNRGDAIIDAHPAGVGDLGESGAFEVSLAKPHSAYLSEVEIYDGEACLSSSNESSRYLAISWLDVVLDGEVYAELYLQSDRFDFQLGDAYAEFHYYTEPTTVSGDCVITYDDGFSTHYRFPELTMSAGWNVLTGSIIELTDASEVYEFRLGSEESLIWDFELTGFEVGEEYSGIGAAVAYFEDRLGFSVVDAGGPAETSGLLADDIIVAIDGEGTRNMSIGPVISRLRGETGDPVSIRVLRQGEELEFVVIRDFLIIPAD